MPKRKRKKGEQVVIENKATKKMSGEVKRKQSKRNILFLPVLSVLAVGNNIRVDQFFILRSIKFRMSRTNFILLV